MHKTRHYGATSGLLLALLSCAVPASWAGERTPIDETRPLAADGKLTINNLAGNIVVRGWDRNEVAISGTLGEDVEKLDISGDAKQLSIVVRYPSRMHGHVDDTELQLRVPAHSQLALDAVSADIRVSDTSGRIDAKSVSGDVELMVGSGEINASTVSGDLKVQAPAYKTSLNSVSGDLTATGLRGTLSADTVSGNLSLAGGSFKALKLQSVSGDLDLKLGLDGGGSLNAETLSGDIALRLLQPANAKLTMKTFSGDLHNGFASARNDDDEQVRDLTATLGNGRGQIDLHTFSGDIEVGATGKH